MRAKDVPRKRAESLAALVVASVEGAIVLARARQDSKPLDLVGTELERLIAEAVGGAEPG